MKAIIEGSPESEISSRLETLGCGQPSGGPRFKSGSADQYSLKRPFSDVGSLIKESLVGGALRGR